LGLLSGNTGSRSKSKSRSGINDVKNIQYLKGFGFKGFLIGETFMKEQKPAIAFAKFMKALKSRKADLPKSLK